MLSMSFTHRCLLLSIVLALGTVASGDEKQTAKQKKADKPATKWTYLFDGKSLKDWAKTNFGGEREVTLEDQCIVMVPGNPLTGVHYKGKTKLPTTNYELSLDAMKVSGEDFFCGLTFPVEKSYVSFICGGWAGGVVGISSIDGMDASENETTEFKNFKKGQWYHIRVRVTKDRIRCWIDDEAIVDVDVEDRKLDVRPEVELSKPLGICAFETKAKLKNIRVRPLSEKEIAE